MWMSSGGTTSGLHTDEIDNINCLFDGTKQMVMIDKVKYRLIIIQQEEYDNSYSIYRISGYFGCVKFWLFWAKTGVRKLWLILILALPGSEPILPYF